MIEDKVVTLSVIREKVQRFFSDDNAVIAFADPTKSFVKGSLTEVADLLSALIKKTSANKGIDSKELLNLVSESLESSKEVNGDLHGVFALEKFTAPKFAYVDDVVFWYCMESANTANKATTGEFEDILL